MLGVQVLGQGGKRQGGKMGGAHDKVGAAGRSAPGEASN